MLYIMQITSIITNPAVPVKAPKTIAAINIINIEDSEFTEKTFFKTENTTVIELKKIIIIGMINPMLSNIFPSMSCIPIPIIKTIIIPIANGNLNKLLSI